MTDKLLINVLYLFCNAFRIYTIFVFISLFLKRRSGFRLYEALSFAAYFIINSSVYLIWDSPKLNLFINVCIIYLLTLLYEARTSIRALTTIIVFTVSILTESIVVVFFNYEPNTFESSITLVATCLFLFATVISIRSHTKIKHDGIFSIFHSASISVISAISMFIAIVLLSPNLRKEHVWITISLTLLLAMNFMVIHLYDSLKDKARQVHMKELLNQQNNLYIKQYETIFKSQENLRIAQHDMKGHMSSLQILIKDDKQTEAIAYMQNIFHTLSFDKNTLNTGNVALDSIINYKVQEASSLGIEFELHVKVPPQLKISSFDLSAVLFNLLDNAISAVEKLSEEHKRRISLSLRLDRGVLYINVSNPFDGKVLYQDGHITTTKQDSKNHGYGLVSVQKTLEKYEGAMEMKLENGVFIVDVLMYDSLIQF